MNNIVLYPDRPELRRTRLAQNAIDKRSRILAAARELFATKGYEKVPVCDIVKQAGVAQGTFYRYFPSKIDLMDALADQLDQDLFTALGAVFDAALDEGETIPLPQVFRRLVYTALETVTPYRDMLRSFDADAMLFGSSQEAEQRREPYLLRLNELLKKRQAQNEIATHLNLDFVVRLLDSILNRIARDLVTREGIDAEGYIEQAVAFIHGGLRVSRS